MKIVNTGVYQHISLKKRLMNALKASGFVIRKY